MKRLFVSAATVALLVASLSGTARANAEYASVIDDHPVRIVAYPVNMVGTLLQWVFFRPYHYVMSLPYVSDISGHKLNETLITDSKSGVAL